MTVWRVTPPASWSCVYWLGTVDKPELVAVTILPAPETRNPGERAQAICDALNHYDTGLCGCGHRCDLGGCHCPASCYEHEHQAAT